MRVFLIHFLIKSRKVTERILNLKAPTNYMEDLVIKRRFSLFSWFGSIPGFPLDAIRLQNGFPETTRKHTAAQGLMLDQPQVTVKAFIEIKSRCNARWYFNTVHSSTGAVNKCGT